MKTQAIWIGMGLLIGATTIIGLVNLWQASIGRNYPASLTVGVFDLVVVAILATIIAQGWLSSRR